MNTSAITVEVRDLAVDKDRPAKAAESHRSFLMALVTPFQKLTSKAAKKHPKDQSYQDYLETMSVLTGF
jgi:hypothetical protein